MRIAITGGTGFVGGHLAEALEREGHEIVLIARGSRGAGAGSASVAAAAVFASNLSSAEKLVAAFSGCDAVAHCAGINREIGRQTYGRVHIEGTANVVAAARRAGVRKLVFLSFLRARAGCGSAYHESKWAAEEIVRGSGLDYTIFKAGMTYGRGDHMLDHVGRAVHTVPLIATVGMKEKPIRPLAIEDLVVALRAALIERRMSRQTFAITGTEQLMLSEAFRRVARELGKGAVVVPAPVWFQFLLAWVSECAMKVPLVSVAQVRILSEGVVEPASHCDPLPADLAPQRPFSSAQIRAGLPDPGPFGLRDLRCCVRR